MNKIKRYIDFLNRDVWRIQARHLSGKRSFWLRPLRIILLALRGFNEDKCQLRASALTYYSLLSIVPMAAMAFGVAKGFGLEKILERQLLERLPGQEEVIGQVIGFANTFLENTRGGLIAGIGVGVLFWTVIKVLGNIENSFNDIWGVKKGRSLGRKLNDYLSIMLVCPILLIISSSVTVMITSQVKVIMGKIALLGALSPVIFAILKLLPYAVIWVMFTFIYIFMPNTKVRFKSGLLGGIVGGTVYQVVQWVYINFQIGAAKYGAIYGSFAALPLFLVWLQMSWLIVLFGAEVSFAEQNVETYEFEPDCLKVSHSFKRLLALRIAQLVIRDFHDGQVPKTAEGISHHLEMPIRLANQILFDLTESGILREVKVNGLQVSAYHPARDVAFYTVKNVIETLDQYGIDDIPIASSRELERLRGALEAFSKVIQNSSANLALKDISS